MIQGRTSVKLIWVIVLALAVHLFLLSNSATITAAISSGVGWDWSFSNSDIRIELGYDRSHEEAVIVFSAVSNRPTNVSYQVGSIKRITDLAGYNSSLLVSKNKQSFQLETNIAVHLDSYNPSLEYRLRMPGDLDLPAGDYQVELIPLDRNLPPISIVLRQSKLYELHVNSSPIEFEAFSGPGDYLAKEPISVQVKTNFSGWRLKVHGSPLILVNDAQFDQTEHIPLDRMLVSLDPDGNFVPITEHGVFLGGTQSGSVLFTVYFLLQSTWDDFAGTYEGGSVSFSIVD